jgi:hypothetical protein
MRTTYAARHYITIALLTFSFCLSVGTVAGQDQESLVPTRVEDGAPQWLKTYAFKKPFTFVRLRYNAQSAGGGWATDYPDADINLSKRLKQLTKIDISLDGLVLAPDDPRLAEYSFAYLSANGIWTLSDPQVASLRKYLKNGGFLMIDDSWGEDERKNVLLQMSKVLPDQAPQELPLEHKIFHCVFDLQEKPQVCGIFYAINGRAEGVTWERPDAKNVSYQGITNASGRLMVLICHNTDLADGWERVDDDAWYAQEFSEKLAFPMGINTVFYALTESD